jgi:transcriptional regulator GlxA family with amidase domain
LPDDPRWVRIANRSLRTWIARAAARVQRIGSICTGTMLLAGAGVLNGRRATTVPSGATMCSGCSSCAYTRISTRIFSVERLAQRANMSVRNFGRLFRNRLGSTPAQYVRQARLDEARSQIESDGALRLKAVARRCGFVGEQQLRRAFRQGVGVTPSEYRQRF